MGEGMDIAFFGSSLVSAYWNGAATYYRGVLKALHALGHRITFYEPDAFERQSHRDIADPPYARVVVYPAEAAGVEAALERARGAELIVKASGVGVFDELLESAVLELRRGGNLVAFWDVDAPATLDRAAANADDPFRRCIPRYDMIFTYGGGEPVVAAYTRLGARRCVPIYNAVDPQTHHPVEPQERFRCDLSFMGNRLPDREARVESFFLKPAARLANRTFVLGGNGWADKPIPANVRLLGHVYTADHNAVNCSSTAVLNIARESMARYGFSPATRVFEAVSAGACLITDAWEGLDEFLEPGTEVLSAQDGEEVAAQVESLTPQRARRIGQQGRRRLLAHHTYSHRARRVEEALGIDGRGASAVAAWEVES